MWGDNIDRLRTGATGQQFPINMVILDVFLSISKSSFIKISHDRCLFHPFNAI
jgi:hypothetical protein